MNLALNLPHLDQDKLKTQVFTEIATRIHYQLVSIHPFENGNGRFSCLIADRFLLAWKGPYPVWPEHLNQEGVKWVRNSEEINIVKDK